MFEKRFNKSEYISTVVIKAEENVIVYYGKKKAEQKFDYSDQ